jgi:hypothetical protein
VSIALTPYQARRSGATVLSYLTAREPAYWREQWKAQMGTGAG